MGKLKTNELLNEVSNHIKTKMGFNVEYDGCSDYDGKYLVNTLNPNFWDENGKPKENERRVIHHITFSVSKHYNKERFIIWDKRVNQPFFNCEFCDYEGSFGRYVFTNKEDFYKHIESDYGMDEIEEWWLKKITNTKNEITSPLHSVINQSHIDSKFIKPIGYFKSSRKHFYLLRDELGKLKSTLYNNQFKMVG